MKIKPVMSNESTCVIARNNPNTKGTHLFITSGPVKEEKRDVSNIALLSLMYEKGFLKNTLEQTIASSSTFVNDYEKNNVMRL